MQGDFMRALGALGFAGAGAGLALAGAAATGRLGGHTTIEQYTVASTASTPGRAGSGRALSVAEIYRLDAPGVVRISGPTGAQAQAHRALGSGFVIDKAGHIITSNRLIEGAGALRVSFSANDELSATLVGKDPATDVAVLQIDVHSRSLNPLPLGDSDAIQVGDPVVAIGNPLSLSRTATVGIVSGVRRTIDAPTGSAPIDRVIQTDARIDRGNAGGPLINVRGEVIGMNATNAGATTQDSAGRGFAVPIDTIRTVAAELIHYGKVEHVFLGVDAIPVNPSLARICDLPASHGLLVQSVAPRSPAAAAGLRAGSTPLVVAGESYLIGGDIIVRADGTPITSAAHLRDLLQTKKPGQSLSLLLWRGKERTTVHVTLGRPPG